MPECRRRRWSFRSVALQSCATRGFPCGFTRAARERCATFQSRAATGQQDWTNRFTGAIRRFTFDESGSGHASSLRCTPSAHAVWFNGGIAMRISNRAIAGTACRFGHGLQGHLALGIRNKRWRGQVRRQGVCARLQVDLLGKMELVLTRWTASTFTQSLSDSRGRAVDATGSED